MTIHGEETEPLILAFGLQPDFWDKANGCVVMAFSGWEGRSAFAYIVKWNIKGIVKSEITPKTHHKGLFTRFGLGTWLEGIYILLCKFKSKSSELKVPTMTENKCFVCVNVSEGVWCHSRLNVTIYVSMKYEQHSYITVDISFFSHLAISYSSVSWLWAIGCKPHAVLTLSSTLPLAIQVQSVKQEQFASEWAKWLFRQRCGLWEKYWYCSVCFSIHNIRWVNKFRISMLYGFSQ